jgi:hypothetical protein
MKISLNGVLPSEEQLKELFKTLPDSFKLGGWSEYEENIEWERMEIIWGNNILLTSGYTGLWELIDLETKWKKMKKKLRKEILNELLEFFIKEFEYEDSIGLFVDG